MPTPDTSDHWETVYARKAPGDVSWHSDHLDRSLATIAAAQLPRGARIIDVGGGDSTLVDDLLAAGYRDITVADLSATALDRSRQRLGLAGGSVSWLRGDITAIELPTAGYELWHDRAVFHFLTDPAQRAAYVQQVTRAVAPGGFVLVATFGPDGPERCSDLPTRCYDAESLHAEFGDRFELVSHALEEHTTPWGSTQQFVYGLCRVGSG